MPPGGRGPSRPRATLVYKLIALTGIVALIGFLVFVVVRNGQPATTPAASFPQTHPSSIPVGSEAPSFTLPRLGGGANVSLATAHGEPVMINFFASWCTDCRRELGAVATVAQEVQGKVATIGIDTSDTSTSAPEKLLASARATYPVGVDRDATVANGKYAITGLPVTFFVSANGRVLGVAFGPQTVTSLEHRLVSLHLVKSPVTP